MKITPRRIFGVIVLIGISLTLLVSNFKTQSQILLTAQENKFQVNFHIAQKDQENFSEVLASLNLPQNIVEGLEFELDATSSAKLAYVSPIQASLKFAKNRLNFAGRASAQVFESKIITPFKIPSSATITVIGASITDLVKARLKLPRVLEAWLDQNLTSQNAKTLIIFGQNSDFALILAPQSAPTLSGLESIKIEDYKDQIYKQETYLLENAPSINLHLLKFPNQDQKETTLIFFEIGQTLYMTSSIEAAKELIMVQVGQSPSQDFLSGEIDPITLAIFLKHHNSQLTRSALDFFISSDTINLPDGIEKFFFILREKEFKGYLDFSS